MAAQAHTPGPIEGWVICIQSTYPQFEIGHAYFVTDDYPDVISTMEHLEFSNGWVAPAYWFRNANANDRAAIAKAEER